MKNTLNRRAKKPSRFNAARGLASRARLRYTQFSVLFYARRNGKTPVVIPPMKRLSTTTSVSVLESNESGSESCGALRFA